MPKNTLIKVLGELESAATALQESLLARDTDSIWRNLEWQERSLEQLGALRHDTTFRMGEHIAADPEARQLLRRGLAVVQANRALSQRFLDVVSKTFSTLCGNRSDATYTSAYAVPGAGAAPVLVSRRG